MQQVSGQHASFQSYRSLNYYERHEASFLRRFRFEGNLAITRKPQWKFEHGQQSSLQTVHSQDLPSFDILSVGHLYESDQSMMKELLTAALLRLVSTTWHIQDCSS